MKSSAFLLVSGILLSLVSLTWAYAASGDTETASQTSTESVVTIETPLLVETIKVEDDAHVTVVFNQDIIRESVRVRISKQSDESNVRIESFTGGTDARSVSVILADTLNFDTAYKMTIISAISEDGIIIKDGADGIKEFTTPVDLKKYEEAPIVLNAPNNPNAVLVASSGSTDTVASSGTNLPKPATVTPSETTDELPLTGMDSTIFIAIAAALGLILILRRRTV